LREASYNEHAIPDMFYTINNVTADLAVTGSVSDNYDGADA
jgi:hypothetical protein